MLLSSHADGPLPKNLITINQLPTYIDKERPPTKKEPFRTICDFTYCHTLSIVSSSDYITTDGWQQAVQQAGALHYAKVHMKLIDIVSGDFFSDYIKTGNILMLSEGRPGSDETYTLSEGILRLEVTKPTFERLGLDGKVIASQGRKHTKARYAIELNLRLPSMVRGKKGFERVLWAFSNVLVDAKTWLFCNIKAHADLSGPISAYAPSIREVTPSVESQDGITVPIFTLDEETDAEDITSLQEWTSLVTIDSPRVREDDKIDTYLSRYEAPELTPSEDTAQAEPSTVLVIQWRGLIHYTFVKALYMLLLTSGGTNGWLALTAHGFDGNAYMVVKKGKAVAISRSID